MDMPMVKVVRLYLMIPVAEYGHKTAHEALISDRLCEAELHIVGAVCFTLETWIVLWVHGATPFRCKVFPCLIVGTNCRVKLVDCAVEY